MIITIDGPVASGKSTVARLLAQELGFYYINSGLMFRACAYLLVTRYGYTASMLEQQSGHDILALLKNHTIEYRYTNTALLLIDGEDVTPYLKTAAIDKAASLVSLHEPVRALVLQMQRDLAVHHSCIVEGRDAGTIIFPHADFHFYLTASVAVRAARWQKDQAAKGNHVSLQEAITTIQERDRRDSTRAQAPLRPADDAIMVDVGLQSVEEVVSELVNHIALQ